MTGNQAFIRKVVYVAIIALLLLPLAALSQPATVGPKGRPELGSPGGKLAQLRVQHNLAQAELGEIDPASETMKLASLGLRGVAANILWGQAHHYKKIEDWDKCEATVNQIIRLQPNYLKVWDFQAHNLSYNISAEFDDYRMRYSWVKKGIEFLIQGTFYNRDEPGLLSQVGWFVGQKVGRSDEKSQFRVMFKTDHDFHQLFRENGVEVDQVAAHGPDGKPDNWLVSRLWYYKATDAVTSLGRPIRGMAPVLFYERVPKSRINAADAMQRDGFFFDVTKDAWEQAAAEWRTFGDRELPTMAGFSVRMNDKEQLQEDNKKLLAEVEKIAPGLIGQLRDEKLPKLTPEQRAAWEKPEDQRTVDERYAADYAKIVLNVTPEEILQRAPRQTRPRIRPLVDQMLNNERIILEINRNRTVVAFEYWRTRVEAEKTDEARQARKDVYDADKLFEKGFQLQESRRLYESAWDGWAILFERYPELMNNAEAQELIESIARYRDLLGQLDQPFPSDFKLNDLLDSQYEGQQLRDSIRLIQGTQATPTDKAPPQKPDSDKPASDKPESENPKSDAPASSKPAAESAPAAEKPASEKPADETP
jgi:hypothetical protein